MGRTIGASLILSSPASRATTTGTGRTGDRLEPEHGAVRRVASRPELGRDVEIAVRALLHITDADVELPEERFASLGL